MSRSYINATTKSNLLLPPSREELLAREPDLLSIDQSIDFDQLRVVIETAISKYKEDNASVDNTMSHDHDDVILKPFTESSCPRSKYSRKNAGRPSYDPIIFFKIFILQILFNLSDAMVHKYILDRQSFLAFLDIDVTLVPSSKTIWKYRELFIKAGVFELINILTMQHIAQLDEVKNSDSIAIDSSFTNVPIQRNTRDENKVIKDGNGDQLWNDHPAKKRQKDIDSRWTQKGGHRYYGYKLHIAVCCLTKLITSMLTTAACVHDSQVIAPLVREEDHGKSLYADSAYSGKKQIDEIKQLNLKPAVCEKGKRNTPLTDEQKKNNREKSKTRARVEHVFAQIAHWDGDILRTIGKKRADSYHHMLVWCYNIKRLMFLGLPLPF
ncbi:IS5 family transposase [uncultured Anaerobiospirillum sp.]|uniref:IS5 family transposase n=3 Tax=Anaerobiospirillum TaxID=13334 RepID=UPI002804A916|nr:IS5 family transposase [uncultured Anaerobiospirillum sp.]